MKKCLFGHQKLVYKHTFPPRSSPIIECGECGALWHGDGRSWTGSMGMSFHAGEKQLPEKTVIKLLDDYNFQRYIDKTDAKALADIARRSTPNAACLMDGEFARAVRAMVKLPENPETLKFVSECLKDKHSFACPEFSALVFIYVRKEFLDDLESLLIKRIGGTHLPVYFYMAFPKLGTPRANEILLQHLERMAERGDTDSYGNEYAFAANAALEFHANYERLGEIAITTAKAFKLSNRWHKNGRNVSHQKPVYELADAVGAALNGHSFAERLEEL